MNKKELQIFIIKGKINENKNYLAKTDYQAIKYAEGEISASDYAPIKAKRADCRAEINRLQEELRELSSIE